MNDSLIKGLSFAVSIFLLLLASCANPIHVPRSKAEAHFNNMVGQPFLNKNKYFDLVNETQDVQEYVLDKNHPCSVIVRVKKDSNIVESWIFAHPNTCYE